MAKKLVTFRFDDGAAAAVKVAEEMAAILVTEITKDTEEMLRILISTAIADGIPPYEAARAIVPMIGLTSAQAQAALKYREELIDSGLTLDKVNEQTDKYSDKLLRRRGETIARTEILDALNTGQEEAWLQAQEEGLLSEGATKEIILSDDACPVCQALADRGPVPIGEEFAEDGPPFHPRCRCSIAIGTS